MMDCSQFQGLLADIDRAGVLAAEVREQALAHAAACGECAQLLTETESLDAELQRLRKGDADLQAPVRLEAHLLREFRERKAVGARERKWRYAAVIGIAAMILLSLGLWTYRRSTRAVRAPVAQKSEPKAAGAPNLQASNSQPPAPTAQGAASKPINGTTQSASDQPSEAENAAFIPLPYADDPGSLEDGAVVRVVMPRAALASFGLPVAAMEGEGTVRADLIVSEDGTPQAIRLISQEGTSGSTQR